MASVGGPDAFAAIWASTVDRPADAMFLVYEGPEGLVSRWTYGQFDEVVRRGAGTVV